MLNVVQPFDPADSPGPIPSVIERFRAHRDRPEEPFGPAAEAARFTVVLVPPEATDPLGFGRGEPGLKVYLDEDWDYDVANLDDAVEMIHKSVGAAVTLVEHRADLTYWTTQLV